MRLGILFTGEVEAAGLMGLFSWGEDGAIYWANEPTDEQKATLQAILDAHDSDKEAALAECYAKRKAAYGSEAEQIDYLVHNGVDALIARNQAIKVQFPKPS